MQRWTGFAISTRTEIITQYYAAKIVNPIRDLYRTIFMELLITIRCSIIHFCASFLFSSLLLSSLLDRKCGGRERDNMCVQ